MLILLSLLSFMQKSPSEIVFAFLTFHLVRVVNTTLLEYVCNAFSISKN